MVPQSDLEKLINSFSDPALMIDLNEAGEFFLAVVNRAAENHFSPHNTNVRNGTNSVMGLSEFPAEQVQSLVVLQRCARKKLPGNHDREVGGDQWDRQVVPFTGNRGEIERLQITSTTTTHLEAVREDLEPMLSRPKSKFVAICTKCKKVRYQSQWQSLEGYISQQSGLDELEIGVCPDCRQSPLYGVRRFS